MLRESIICTINVCNLSLSSSSWSSSVVLTVADNPTDLVAGNQHWGHATSQDLYHWVNQPIALFPGNETQNIFSGSCVIDRNNTSGFFPNQDNGVVAIYTLNTPFDQSQDLAISYDSGYTFEKYEGNPVITIGSIQFRDPKVIWHDPTQKWVMTISYSQEFAIGIFTSDNLIDWKSESNFSYHGLLGLQWEVPNLIEIPVEGGDQATMWLMLVSINPGAPLGGSITQYSPGEFNGTHFIPVDSAARIADFGKDNYAGGFFGGVPADQRQISIAWASNWQYSQSNPTGPREGWRSAMSLPRENYLTFATRIGYVLNSYPYDISPVFPDEPLAADGDLGNGTVEVDFSGLESKTVYFEVNITSFPEKNPSGTANFTFLSSGSGESLNGGQYLSGDNPFWLNRGKIGGFDDPFFTDKFSTNVPYDPDTSAFTITGVLDRSIFEVFLQGGKHSATITFFPEEPLDTMTFSTAELPDGVGVSIAVWGLDSAWDQYKDADGTVVGNVTTGEPHGNGTDSGNNGTAEYGQKMRRDTMRLRRSKRLY
jgi:beta-fructofuranosidase